MFLIFVGGIGFPVLMECREWLLYKRSSAKLPFRFSLFTKLAVLAFVILFVSVTILIYLFGKGPFIPRFQYECQMDQFDVLFDHDS